MRLQKDDRLVAMMRDGQERAFEVLFERYHARLLGFCQHMLSSREDAEDVLQEVFVAAHNAILADSRALNMRPWLYRIARNRCLNHLRKPVPDGQDSMDIHPHENGASTAERVQNREEFRRLVADVQTLPETQRTALLLREVDAMSYEEIAQSMDTTVPSIKSLLVRARITLAESSQARLLTCGEVQLELAEAAEGLRKVSGPVRQHVRSCDGCSAFRSQLHTDSRALAALFPVGPLVALKQLLGAKLAAITGGGSSAGGGATAGGGAAAGGAAVAGGAAAGGAAAGGAALGGAAAGGGIGGALVGGIGAKTAAGVATAALLTAGAVEVKKQYGGESANQGATAVPAAVAHAGAAHEPRVHHHQAEPAAQPAPETPAEEPPAAADQVPEPAPAPAPAPAEEVPATEPSGAPAETEPAADGSADEPTTDETEEEGSGEVETDPAPDLVEPPPLPPEDPAKPPLLPMVPSAEY